MVFVKRLRNCPRYGDGAVLTKQAKTARFSVGIDRTDINALRFLDWNIWPRWAMGDVTSHVTVQLCKENLLFLGIIEALFN